MNTIATASQQLAFRTLTEALLAAPAEHAFVTMWNNEDNVHTTTFREFTRWAYLQAAYFREQGLQPNETVILIMPQGVALMTAFVGAILLGAVPAILAYPTFKVEPSKYRFGLSGVSANLKAKLLVVDASFPQDLLEYIRVGDLCKLVCAVASPDPAAEVGFAPRAYDPRQLAFIQHSAGTTGLQKGVALSHAAVLRQLGHLTAALEITTGDRIYSWLPLYHDMGLIACFMLPMVSHLHVVMQSPTDWVMRPASMLRLISEHRCTIAWVPNFTLQFLARRVDVEDRKEFDLRSLRALINCSEPVRAASMDEFKAAFSACGLRPEALQSSYAMAENVFAVTQSATNRSGMPRRVWVESQAYYRDHVAVPVAENSSGSLCLVSSGECIPGNEVRVVSEDGCDLPHGRVGEILIRSDSMLEGYYNRPDLTSEALRDGWYWSGDLGFCLHEDLYVTGRKKDLIIVGGKNIYPQDIEEIVSSHPAIQDGRALACGVFDPELGTESIVVVAEVKDENQLQDPLPVEQAICNAIVAELGVAARGVYLKPPRWIVKSTAGKAARSTTREKLLAEHPELSSG